MNKKERFITNSARVLATSVAAVFIGEVLPPRVAHAQEPTSVTSPEMYRGVDITEVPELQINYVGKLFTELATRSSYCTMGALEDPQTPGETRFILIGSHCADDRFDSALNPSALTARFANQFEDLFTVVRVIPIPGSTDSSLAVLEKPVKLGAVSALRIATEVEPEVMGAGYGRWEQPSSPPNPRYGNFIARDISSTSLNIIGHQETASQTFYGDSGMTVINKTPLKTKGTDGQEVLIYEAVGTVVGLPYQINPNDPTDLGPTIVSAVFGPEKQEFIYSTMDQYRNQELPPVPHTRTGFNIDGKQAEWALSQTNEIISQPGSKSISLELLHLPDLQEETTLEVSNVQLTQMNDAPDVTAQLVVFGDKLVLQPGKNLIGLIDVDFKTGHRTPFSNAWETFKLSALVTKILPDGETLTETINHIFHYDVHHSLIYDIESSAQDVPLYETDTTKVTAKHDNSTLTLSLTSTERPSRVFLTLRKGWVEHNLTVELVWNAGNDASQQTTEVTVELPDELKGQLQTYIPKVMGGSSFSLPSN